MCAGLWVAKKVFPFLEKKEWGLRSDECARIRFTSLPMSGPINMLKTGSIQEKNCGQTLVLDRHMSTATHLQHPDPPVHKYMLANSKP